jgi:NTE family protein
MARITDLHHFRLVGPVLSFTLGVLLPLIGRADGTGPAAVSAGQPARQSVNQSASGQSASGQAPGSRPRIGLVLGGGGAKGAAHIGVMRVLDELRIPIDCIAGTSMGALIGATYAAGSPPEEIERSVRAINWSATVGNEGLRDRTPINRKLAGITYTNTLDLGLKGAALRAPGGLLKTQDIEDVLRILVADARGVRDFDELPIPFRAVATDMRAGEIVVLEDGDLAVAMRASMAVPGAFSPVVRGERVLADGGLMRNLPVDIARGLCADVVIAVALQSPAPQNDDLLSALSLAGRALDVMIDTNQNAQLASLKPDDVGILVPMGDIGSAAFDRVPDAIPLGYAAARDYVDKLRRYSLPEAEYAAWRATVVRPGRGKTRLADVRIRGLDRVNPAYVQAQLQNVAPGAEVAPAEIVADTQRIYALGDFERVEYRLRGPAESPVLDIRPVEKSWGPDFVRFDLGLVANGDGVLQALLRADHARTWINSRGGQWSSAVQIGFQSIARTGFYQPFDVRQRFFVQPFIEYQRNLEDVYDDGDRRARYVLQENFAQVDLGMNLGTRAQLRAGIRSGVIDADVDTGEALLPELDREGDAALVLGLVYDTRDAVGLPTRGTFINARYERSGSWLGGDQDYDLIEGVVTRSWPWRGDALTLALGGGAELAGDLPVTQFFQLGGIRTFPGLQRSELRGSKYWFASSAYNFKIADVQPLFGQALYAGLRLQAGRMGGRLDSANADTGVSYGISGNVGGRTPVGPFILSLGYVTDDSWQLQFAVGRPVSEGSIFDEIR